MCFTITKNTRRHSNIAATFPKVFTLHLWLNEGIVNYILKGLHTSHIYLHGKATDNNVKELTLSLSTNEEDITQSNTTHIRSGYHFLTHTTFSTVEKVEEIAKTLCEGVDVSLNITINITALRRIYVDIAEGVGVCAKFESDLTIISPAFTEDGNQVTPHLDSVLLAIQDAVEEQSVKHVE